MRVTGGIHRGRILKVPEGLEVRPTQDRVREALFSMLMHEIAGARFLDLFAGSGAVGIEAVSRGAKEAVFVEKNARHAAFIRDNARTVGIQADVAIDDALRYVGEFRGEPFDIAFADPPYAEWNGIGFAEMLGKIASGGAVRPGGIFTAEASLSAESAGDVEGWDLCRDRAYGKSRLLVWRRHG